MSQQLTPAECIELIKKHEFAVQKKFGQNFLIDNNVLSSIVSAAEISKEDCVLEIGPGMGALTSYLLRAAKKVVAVEVDRMLIPILNNVLSPFDNFTLINDDILKVNIDRLIEDENDGKPIKIVANLPYYITTPIVMELLEGNHKIESITVMIQKEVAVRMMEGPGNKAYGALSLAVQYYSNPKIVMDVSKNSFYPKPDVDSAVIRMDVYAADDRPVRVKDTEKLFKIVRSAFGQRRKTLVNSLANAGFNKTDIITAINAIGKSEAIRGEVLTLQEFATLADNLK